MRLLIIDDEQPAIRDLTVVLSEVEPDAVIESTVSQEDAVSMCREHEYDVAFLDINMPGKGGLALAKELKAVRPMINIIIVTAYPQYALDAHRLYVSGYILKPAGETEVREAMRNLRNPILTNREGLYVRCFGDFEVFYNGEPVRFKRSKTKEMFAYLVDRHGSVVTGGQLRTILWGDEMADEGRLSNYFSQLTHDIKSTFDEIGCGDVLDISRNAYAVVPDKINCDLYRELKKDHDFLSHYTGEYMSQYSWMEF